MSPIAQLVGYVGLYASAFADDTLAANQEIDSPENVAAFSDTARKIAWNTLFRGAQIPQQWGTCRGCGRTHASGETDRCAICGGEVFDV